MKLHGHVSYGGLYFRYKHQISWFCTCSIKNVNISKHSHLTPIYKSIHFLKVYKPRNTFLSVSSLYSFCVKLYIFFYWTQITCHCPSSLSFIGYPSHIALTLKKKLIVFKIVNNCAPQYLINMLTLYKPVRNLRSSHDQTQLVVPRFNLSLSGQCFSIYSSKSVEWIFTFINQGSSISCRI